jgi:hypothetical protein
LKNVPIVTRDEGKTEIGFGRSNGLLGSKFEVYNSIEALARDANKKNYGAPRY